VVIGAGVEERLELMAMTSIPQQHINENKLFSVKEQSILSIKKILHLATAPGAVFLLTIRALAGTLLICLLENLTSINKRCTCEIYISLIAYMSV
jgi:hypothetical protein